MSPEEVKALRQQLEAYRNADDRLHEVDEAHAGIPHYRLTPEQRQAELQTDEAREAAYLAIPYRITLAEWCLELADRLQKAEEALGFYADRKHWQGPNVWDKERGDYAPSVARDEGRVARGFLGLPVEPA